jgi:predicted DNA-binding transcriptional regulator AlpA
MPNTREVCARTSIMPKFHKPKTRKYTRRISARFMITEEFADLLGVTSRTIQRRTADGSIEGWPPAIRIGPNITLYERTDVERFLLQARDRKPAAQPVEEVK